MELGVGTEYINASFIVDNIRQIKSAEEQDLMRQASRLNDLGCEKLIPLECQKVIQNLEMGSIT